MYKGVLSLLHFVWRGILGVSFEVQVRLRRIRPVFIWICINADFHSPGAYRFENILIKRYIIYF